jgi:hypothetical protein
MVFPFGNPKHLHTKEDYLTADMLQRRLQYSYITKWLATYGKVEEGVLSEGSHSSAGYGSMVLCSVVSLICYPVSPFIVMERYFNYLDNTIPSVCIYIWCRYSSPMVMDQRSITWIQRFIRPIESHTHNRSILRARPCHPFNLTPPDRPHDS